MRLAKYEERLKEKVEHYVLTEEQLQFTSTPRASIELSQKDVDRYPIVVMDDDELVTFFVLHENDGVKPFSDNPQALLLRSFSTEYSQQGKGYATKTLVQLPAFVRENFPKVNQVILGVNVNNKVAQSLYEKCGFVDEGKRTMGNKGQLIIMSYYL